MNKDRFKLALTLLILILCALLCSCSGSGGDLFDGGNDLPDIADTVDGPEDPQPSEGEQLPDGKTPDEEGEPESESESSDGGKEPEGSEDNGAQNDGDEPQNPPVPPVEAESVSLDKNNITLYVGDRVTVKATVLPSDTADKSLVWSSSDANSVTVDGNGNITGVDLGKAVVTAISANGKSASVTVTVEKRPIPVDSITLLPVGIEIFEGQTAYAVPYILPEDADDKSVTFTSSDPSVVTVNEKGLVTAVREGTATVKATTSNGKTASIPVTVKGLKLEESRYEYYYNSLTSEREQKIYVALRDAMAGCVKEVTEATTVYTADTEGEIIDRIFRLVLLDHPEFFHVAPEYSRHTVGGVTTQLSLSYNMSQKDYEKALEDLESSLEPLFEKIRKTVGEAERALVAYGYVKDRLVYDKTDLSSACNLYKAFLSGKAVCEGYSKLFGYILKKSGIASLQVTGDIADGGHQWTMAMINGQWYHFDPTWDDPVTVASRPETALDLNYFAVPDEMIYETRTAHMSDILPRAKNLDDNYFVLNKLVLADLSAESMSAVARRSDSLVGHIALLCSRVVYDVILKDNSYLWLLVGYVDDSASSISYLCNESTQVIEIFYK